MDKIIYAVVVFIISACTSVPPVSKDPTNPPKETKLSWNKPWDETLLSEIRKSLGVFSGANDIEEICPKFKALPKEKQVHAIAEFFVALAYYESGWKPKSASVDVGKKENRDTWSIGLYQVSVVDQQWVKADRKYSYDELLTAEPNIKLAMAIMKRQIEKTGEIILPNSSKYRYWSVLLESNRYSKIAEIKQRVAQNTECSK